MADSDLTVDTVVVDKIRWQINGFFSKLKNRSGFTIEGRNDAIVNDVYKLELHHFDLSFTRNSGYFVLALYIISPINNCEIIVMIEKIDGSKFFERYAKKRLNHQEYTCNLPLAEEFLKFERDLTADGNLTIIIRITADTSKSEETLECPENWKDLKEASSQTESLESVDTLSDNLKDLLASGDHSDVTIIAGNREFRAHKVVLVARSSVLNSMFSNDMIENNSGILKIPDCDGDVFQAFLTFLYSGKLDEIDSCEVAGLYAISDKYDLDALKKECLKRLMVSVSVDSVCDIMHVAVLYQEARLLDVATKFFVDNAEDVLATVKWKNFLKEHSEIGNELFMKYIKNIKEKK